MKTLGLVTEYNPFHNGHLYHLRQSLKATGATHSVAVMSGHFLQRGEPALLHKWARAQMAVAAGVDLVIELPTVYACNTAELFAYGSVKLLESLGFVDTLCFGSEKGQLEKLDLIAQLLIEAPPGLRDAIQLYLSAGFSFPAARSQGIRSYLKAQQDLSEPELDEITTLLSGPNNILSIEYLKALKKIKSPIQAATVKRKQADYHSTAVTSTIVSATAIRNHLNQGLSLHLLAKTVPETTFSLLENAFNQGMGPVQLNAFDQMIIAALRRTTPTALKETFDVTEGLENRILRAAGRNSQIHALVDEIKTKRYPYTRIQRILIHQLLGLRAEDINHFQRAGGPQYIRVLAFNHRGRALLRLANKKATLPIINKIHQFHSDNELAHQMLSFDLRATDLYRLAIPNQSFGVQPLDYTQSPVYLPL